MTEEQIKQRHKEWWDNNEEKFETPYDYSVLCCISLINEITKELQEENARLKKESEENRDLATIAYMQGASKYRTKLDSKIRELQEAKTIIQDILNNSDEYARQRAMDFLKESE